MFFALLLVSSVSFCVGQYLEKTNKNVLFMNLCAGSNNPDVCVPQHFSYTVLKQFTTSCTDLIWDGNCEATVMVSDVDMAVAVFFRGPTGAYTNFLKNGPSELSSMSQAAFGSNGNVGEDYSIAFDGLWNDQGLAAYLQQTWADYCDYVLLVSGHSVGSCLAQMAAVSAVPWNLWPAGNIIYYGYGTPRCGDPTFASAVSSSTGIAYMVNWNTDSIPTLPARSVTWQHCCNTVLVKPGILGTTTTTHCAAEADAACLKGTGTSDHVAYWGTKQSQYDSLTCGSTMIFAPDP